MEIFSHVGFLPLNASLCQVDIKLDSTEGWLLRGGASTEELVTKGGANTESLATKADNLGRSVF